MYNEKWFRVLAWTTASFFFFINACILICTLGPPPGEAQVKLWMSGMMQAMHSSMMAFSMQLEEGSRLMSLVYNSAQMVLPLMLGGFLTGLFYRRIKHENKST